MSFQPTTCPDCFYPPNFTVLQLKDKDNCIYYSVKCRDCGDCWDEPGEFFSENFFENTDVDDE